MENENCRFVACRGKYTLAINRVEYNFIENGSIKLRNFILEGNGQTSLSISVNMPNGDTLIVRASSTDEIGKALITAITSKGME